MAGHSKFKNIQHRKNAQDNKRAKLFTKLVREIITAARMGQPDPNFNPRLRAALSTARVNNMPKANIENALKKATDPNSGDNYEEMRYEGYGPSGVAIIVESLTDNRNRTASEVRAAFTKSGGMLGESGSVNFLFSHQGYIKYAKTAVANLDVFMEAALEGNAEECEEQEDCFEAYSKVENFTTLRDALVEKFGDAEEAKIVWMPHDHTIISDFEVASKIVKLIDSLEENDDVQEVYANCEFSKEVVEKLGNL